MELLQIRQLSLLQSAMDLSQIATGITKWDDYYKLRQYCINNDSRNFISELACSLHKSIK